MEFNKKELIKSPLNYTGGKYKLLPKILPLFPEDIDTFVDLFCGGGNVGINVKANSVIMNDIEPHVIDLLKWFKENEPFYVINTVEQIAKEFGLSDTFKNGYSYYNVTSNEGVGKVNKVAQLKLRDYYNKNKSPEYFFTLLVHSFNNQIRFNSNGKYNISSNCRDFNKSLRSKTYKFTERLGEDCEFTCMDFRNFSFGNCDFVYADPPYLISTATYNENGGWTEKEEKDLLSLLDELNENEIKFALSNVLEHKGRSNDILKEWSKKYNIHYLNYDYKNCSYQGKNTDKPTIEVLITNY